MDQVKHVVWINRSAEASGGAEQYVFQTARHLAACGVRSSLLYDVGSPVSPEVLGVFDAAFPLVDAESQLKALAPDVIYAHQLPGGRLPEALVRSPSRVVRFFHDHQLFCLRQHKYTAIGHEPCARRVGAGCYACLGFVSRAQGFPGLRLNSVSSLLGEQRRNQGAAGFVVASRAMSDELIQHGFDPERVHVLPLYAAPPASPTRPDRGRAGDQLLYVGALTRGKGLDVLLHAMAAMRRPARLTAVGKGPQEQEWRALAAGLGLADRVEFVGSTPRDELSAMYRRATCLVLPVRAPETFGLVGVEAMSHGTPVVASHLGGIPEWLDHGVTGYGVAPGAVDDLAAALDRLLGDPARAQAMGRAAIEAHGRRFLPEHHVKPLLSLFASVARGRA